MIGFLADENFDHRIASGLRRQLPTVIVERVQDIGLRQADDPTILAYAADHDLVVLTHDIRTMPMFAIERIDAGLPMAGLFGVPRSLPIGRVIEDLVLIAVCDDPNEWQGQVRYLPL